MKKIIGLTEKMNHTEVERDEKEKIESKDIFTEEDLLFFTEEEINEIRIKADAIAESIVSDLFPEEETDTFKKKLGEREIKKLIK